MMSCLGDCLDFGPPPSILFLPPPPAPSFLSLRHILDNVTAPCAAQLCEWGGASTSTNGVPGGVASATGGGNKSPPNGVESSNGDYVDMSQREIEGWSDTWLLVLVAATIGVLFLGALLALFLLKCREEHRAQSKHLEQRQIPPTTTTKTRPAPDLGDNRMVWAALTPRGGTQHYVSEGGCSYRAGPHHLPPPVPPPPQPHLITEPEYESIDEHYASAVAYQQRYGKLSSFDNSGYYFPGFADYDYEEPTALTQLGYPTGTQDMRCISTLRRLAPPPRPRVSSPTRIEHPNLPPLNLNPQLNTARRTLSRRPSETNAILKYNIN